MAAMITRIELTNFMSHVHTVIEPARGLTVLVGPNNCGKSAVVAALQILCRNDTSTYVLRHGERECCVKIECDDGHAVEWRRKNAPSYLVDGKPFDRLGRSGLPDEVHQALRLPKVDAGDETDFDVHFGTQKSPIFLLGNSSTNAAKFFASSSDAIRLVQMQKRHKEKLGDANREKTRLEAQSKVVNAELALLEPVAELDRQLKALEREHCDLLQLAAEVERAALAAAAIVSQADIVAQHSALAQSLVDLASPPQLLPTDNLHVLCEQIDRLCRWVESSTSQRQVFSLLASPPELEDTKTLESVLSKLSSAQREENMAQQRAAAMRTTVSPPEIADVTPLSVLIDSMESASRDVARHERQSAALTSAAIPPAPIETAALDTTLKQLEAARSQCAAYQLEAEAISSAAAQTASDLREQVDGSACPVCGGPLDAEKLMMASTADMGGHAHG